MQCPKCPGSLESYTFNSVTVDRCTGCYGLFCHPDTIERMKGVWLAEAVVDMGDPDVGARYDKVGDIDCPECHVKMDKIVDAQQPHIWIEACPSCAKIFLDAGEFTDLKYNTMVDRYRDWLKGARA